MAVLSRAAGVKLRHVPYAGTVPAVNDLLGGQVDAMVLPVPFLAAHINSGKLRALASLTSRRVPVIPSVPTFRELGLPEVELSAWTARLAPRGTPDAVVARLVAAARGATQEASVRSSLERMHSAILFREGEELRRFADIDTRRVLAVLRGGPLPATVAAIQTPPPAPPPVATPAPAPAPPVDASRAQMVRALDDVRRQLGENDNLLIYYAGHGWLDREADRGYWLGVDAEPDTRANWLSNADVTDTLRALKATHVFIVAAATRAASCATSASTRSTRPTWHGSRASARGPCSPRAGSSP